MHYQLKISLIFLVVVSGTSYVYSAAVPEYELYELIEAINKEWRISAELLREWENPKYGFSQVERLFQQYPGLINYLHYKDFPLSGETLLHKELLAASDLDPQDESRPSLINFNGLHRIDFLLKRGADVSIQTKGPFSCCTPETYLMHLSSSVSLYRALIRSDDYQRIFKQLLQGGIDFNAVDTKGWDIRKIVLVLASKRYDRMRGIPYKKRGRELVALLDEKKLQQEEFVIYFKTHIISLIADSCRLDERCIAEIIAKYAYPNYPEVRPPELGALMHKRSYQEIAAEDNVRRFAELRKGAICVIS